MNRRRTALFTIIAAGLLIAPLYIAEPGAVVTTPAGELQVAVADTPNERRQGLMNRSQIPYDGLLFSYSEPGERVFWMKDTAIPLDIVFIGENGAVLNVAHADPQPGVAAENLTRYSSEGEAVQVLEIAQGRAEELGIAKGTHLTVERPVLQSLSFPFPIYNRSAIQTLSVVAWRADGTSSYWGRRGGTTTTS